MLIGYGMEDKGVVVDRENITRMLLTMAVVVIGYMVFQHYFPTKNPEAQPQVQTAPATAPQAAGNVGSGQAAPTALGATELGGGLPPGATEATGLSIVPVSGSAVQAARLGGAVWHGPYALAMELTANGGAIRHIEMSDYFTSVAARGEAKGAGAKFQLIQATAGAPSLVLTRLDMIEKGDKGRELYFARGLSDAVWQLEPGATTEQAAYRLEIEKDGKAFLTLRRVYRVHPRTTPTEHDAFGDGLGYAIDLALEFTDHSGTLRAIGFTMRGPEGLVTEESRGEDRMATAGFADGRERPNFKAGGDGESDDIKKRLFPARPDWVAAVDKYFAVALITRSSDKQESSEHFQSAAVYLAYSEVKLNSDSKSKIPGVVVTSCPLPVAASGTEGVAKLDCLIFAGPKDTKLLDQPVFKDYGLLQLIRWSTGCCPLGGIGPLDALIGGIAKIMVSGINGIAYFVVNKGVAIIILTFLVWLLTFPIYRYSQVAMLRMQDLAPEIAKLKEQCKDDPKKMQLEQMKLYRERGANPIMSCVPMMLQMPIWFALYTGLSVAITLRQAPFVGWVNDLAQPDAALGPFHPVNIAVLSYIGSWANWQLNVLPFLMVVAMFLQMKLQPQPTSTPEMEKQQKLMKFMMPVMMLLFLYSAPSGLNLYILTNSTLGYFGQKYIRRQHDLDKLRPKAPKPPKPKGRIMSFIEDKMEAAQRLQESAGESKWEKKKSKK